jgi:anti-anti-sigma regulatory factor
MTELSIVVDQLPDHGACVIRTAGPLTAWNRHHLRRTVLKCLTDIPTAIIVDVTGLHLVDRIAGAAFVSLRREAARTGPGVALLLCGVRDQLLAQRIRALDRTQPMFADVDEAIGSIYSGPGVARWLYHRLPEGLLAPIEAGMTIADTCTAWGLSHLAFPARAVVFDLHLIARRCPPGQQSLAATYDDNHLLVSVRTPTPPDALMSCARLRPPPGYYHKAGPTGHIVWTALPTMPPDFSR